MISFPTKVPLNFFRFIDYLPSLLPQLDHSPFQIFHFLQLLLPVFGNIVEWNRGTIDQFSAKVVNKLKLSGMVYKSIRNVKPPEGKKFTDQNIEF